MKELASVFFLTGPFRVGQIGFAIERVFRWPHGIPRWYRSSVGWKCISFLGFRLYVYEKDAAVQFPGIQEDLRSGSQGAEEKSVI